MARYTLKVLESEGPGATGALLAEVRQMEDRLGLAPMSMRRLCWEVAEPVSEPDLGNVSWFEDAQRRFA